MLNRSDLRPMPGFRSPAFAVADGVVLLTSIYLLMAVLKWFRKKYKSTSRHESRTSVLLDVLFGIFLILGTSKSCVNFIFFFSSSPKSALDCATLGRAFQFLHAFGSSVLYTFLWLRQNTLYREPVLTALSTKWLVRFSWGLLGVIALTSAAGIVGLMVTSDPSNYHYHNYTCYHIDQNSNNTAVVYTGYAVILFTQGSILFLFTNILHRHRRNMTKSCRLSLKMTDSIDSLITHCCFAAVISSVTAVCVIILDAAVLRSILSQQELYVIWDVEYTINVFCTLYCFKDWRKILCPWKTDNQPLTATSSLRSSSIPNRALDTCESSHL